MLSERKDTSCYDNSQILNGNGTIRKKENEQEKDSSLLPVKQDPFIHEHDDSHENPIKSNKGISKTFVAREDDESEISLSFRQVDQLGKSIQQMFAIPTESIESCFQFLVQMIRDQAKRHVQLKDQFEKEQENNKALRLQIVNAQEGQQQKFELDISQIHSNQKEIMGQIKEIQNEIKVMAYNFHGIDDDDDANQEKEGFGKRNEEEEALSIPIEESSELLDHCSQQSECDSSPEPKDIDESFAVLPKDEKMKENDRESERRSISHAESKNETDENCKAKEDDHNFDFELKAEQTEKNFSETEESDQIKVSKEEHSNTSDTKEDSPNRAENTISVAHIPETDDEQHATAPKVEEAKFLSSTPSQENSSKTEESNIEDEYEEKSSHERMPVPSTLITFRNTAMFKKKASMLSRRASLNISKQKLEVHQTVGNRLERLEECQRKLENGLEEGKNLDQIFKRLKSIEKFLEGFGIVDDVRETEIGKSLEIDNSVNQSFENDSRSTSESKDVPITTDSPSQDRTHKVINLNKKKSKIKINQRDINAGPSYILMENQNPAEMVQIPSKQADDFRKAETFALSTAQKNVAYSISKDFAAQNDSISASQTKDIPFSKNSFEAHGSVQKRSLNPESVPPYSLDRKKSKTEANQLGTDGSAPYASIDSHNLDETNQLCTKQAHDTEHSLISCTTDESDSNSIKSSFSNRNVGKEFPKKANDILKTSASFVNVINACGETEINHKFRSEDQKSTSFGSKQNIPKKSNAVIDSTTNRIEKENIKRRDRNASLIHFLNEQEKKTNQKTERLGNQLKELFEKYEQLLPNQRQDQYSLHSEITRLNNVIADLGDQIQQLASKEDLNALIQNHEDYQDISNHIDELRAFQVHMQEKLRHLHDTKIKMMKEISSVEENIWKNVKDEMFEHRSIIESSTEKFSYDIETCRSCINSLEEKVQELTENDEVSGPNGDLDERIKLATETVRRSLQETLSKKLEDLKIIENELERLSSQLADRPDQNQVVNMLQDLEDVLSERVGNGKMLQTILNNMRIEMTMKTNRDDVLSLVRQIIGETKQGIQNTKDSLMVGRTSVYRCLGCDRSFPAGIHAKRAKPVNHKALPSSGILSKAKSESFGRGRPGVLRPLHVAHNSRRERTRSSVSARFLSKHSPTKTQRILQHISRHRPSNRSV